MQNRAADMAEIVNLRQARKTKTRADKAAKAADNRLAFGRTKAERELSEKERELADRRLEGHRRDEDPSP
jgi:hypothetical protein